MSFYRKRPLVVEAVRLTRSVVVRTREGDMTAAPGDWLITGVRGELYPCPSKTFSQSYEHVAGHSFRKRPVIVEAIRLRHRVSVETAAGTLVGEPGDWLVNSADGGQYPCDATVFEATYEAVGECVADLSST